MTQEIIEKEIDARLNEPDNNFGGIFNSGYSQGFRDGARWRIASVWHKPSAYGNELINGLDVIVKTHKGYRFGIFNAVGYYNEHIGFVSASGIEYPLSDVLEYAYLTDLLPEGKED